jgi:hypothetical protein
VSPANQQSQSNTCLWIVEIRIKRGKRLDIHYERCSQPATDESWADNPRLPLCQFHADIEHEQSRQSFFEGSASALSKRFDATCCQRCGSVLTAERVGDLCERCFVTLATEEVTPSDC